MYGKIRLNLFQSVFDNKVVHWDDFTWQELVDELAGPDARHKVVNSKEEATSFNCCRYNDPGDSVPQELQTFDQDSQQVVVLRRLDNVASVSALLLDFDDAISIAEAKQRYGHLEHLGFTSYNHLAKKGVHKFRLVFPLTRSIPVGAGNMASGDSAEYGQLADALLQFGDGCDPVITNPNQVYFEPSVPLSRFHLADRWHNKGEVLDWTKWPVSGARMAAVSNKVALPAPNGRKNQVLDADIVFQHAKGSVRAGDVTTKIRKVVCPFHTDNKGSEFITRFESGVISFTCHRCGTFSLPPKDPARQAQNAVLPDAASISADTPLEELDELLYGLPDRQRIAKTLSKVEMAVVNDQPTADASTNGKRYKSHLVVLPEGSGKSTLALDLVFGGNGWRSSGTDQGDIAVELPANRIVFACRSWDQAIAKSREFKPVLEQYGLKAKLAFTLDALLRKNFEVKAVRKAAKPFDVGKLDVPATKKKLYESAPDKSKRFLDLSMQMFQHVPKFIDLCRDEMTVSPEARDLPEVDEAEFTTDDMPEAVAMVFTTFARLRVIDSSHDHIPRNWIVWIDDPDVDDLLDIQPVPAADTPEQAPLPNLVVGRKHDKHNADDFTVIDGRRYYVRKKEYGLGYTVMNHRVVYTTTEVLTRNLIVRLATNRNEDLVVYEDMPKLSNAGIRILGTEAVYSRYDGLVPLFVRRLNKEKLECELIADGIGARYNHSNVKGVNTLKRRDLVIKLSVPHPEIVQTICHAMGKQYPADQLAVEQQLMLDRMHQAVGRNSGFRFEGAGCTVLVDPRRYSYVQKETRYHVEKQNSGLIDRTKGMQKKDSRLSAKAASISKRIEQLSNNPADYLIDFRKSKPDIDHVLNTFDSVNSRLKFIVRLLTAFSNVSNASFLSDATKPTQHVDRKIYELGVWLLEKHLPVELHSEVHLRLDAQSAAEVRRVKDLLKLH